MKNIKLLSIRLPPELLEAVKKAASDRGYSVSDFVRLALKEKLKRRSE